MTLAQAKGGTRTAARRIPPPTIGPFGNVNSTEHCYPPFPVDLSFDTFVPLLRLRPRPVDAHDIFHEVLRVLFLRRGGGGSNNDQNNGERSGVWATEQG